VTVNVLDSNGNVLGSATSSTPGATVTVPGVAMPVDGTYHVRIQASPNDPRSTGRYEITVNDVTVNSATVAFNQQYNGSIATTYSVDRWTFSATAGQQIRFNLVAANPTIEFTLTGPNGYMAFNDLTASSDPITLPSSGSYTLSVDALGGQPGAYAFRLDQTAQTTLTLGTTYQGTLAGSGQPQLFRIDLATTESLLVVLKYASAADHNELYLKFGAPPTRSDYQYKFSTPASANQQVLAPAAAAGSWYILLCAALVPAPSSYTITATSGAIFLTGVTPDHSGNAAAAILTLTSSGFDPLTTVSLIAADGTVHPATTTSIDLPTRITATFAAGSVPAGTYTVQVSKSGIAPASLPDAFVIDPGGQSNLQTQIILPNFLGRHATATLYVEYTNTGDVAMPAPLLVLSGTLNPFLTLDPTRVVAGLWTSALPDGFSHSIEILGSGATPGVLQPGETMRVPVYYAGLQQPWVSTPTVTFRLTVTNPDDATPIDWASLQDGLRPRGIDPVAWPPIYADVVSQIGPTWGDFVARIDADASYLGRLGEQVTDVNQLWQFEIRQAIGLAPIGQIASETDVSVPGPGMTLTFSRSYSPLILDRSTVGPFGMDWSLDGGWQETLTTQSDGTVVVSGPDGLEREFQPDSRGNDYFYQPGDHGTLIKNGDGTYSLLEVDDTLTHFLADGQVDYIQDTNGNRITAGYTHGLLTSLTHSDGQSIRIAYNAAGRVTQVTDPYGRTTTFTYDTSNLHLLSARDNDGATTAYTYNLGSNPATQSALLSMTQPDGLDETFSYDAEGRLSGVAENGGSDPIRITYGPYGLVNLTDATNDTTQLDFDNRGLLAKTVDPLGNANYLTFDSSYNLTQFTDAAGRSYQFTYDGQGNLTRATDPLGATTRFTYTSPLDRIASLTDANGNLTSYAYDPEGNLIATTYADGSVERATYDARGNPTTTANRRGDTISYTYNAAGQITSKTYSDGTKDTYTYDVQGNLIATTDPTGTTQYTYDANDRLAQVTYPGGLYLKFAYNIAGQRTSSTDQPGYTLNYQYDALGRLSSITDGTGAAIVTYHYDADGRLARMDMGNGTYTTYAYDAAGNVLHLINYAPNGTINSRFDYTYDNRGRVTSMNTLQGLWTYTYDDDGQLTGWKAPDGSYATYKYDAMGNRILVDQNGVTTDYTTNNMNQYTTVGGVTYTYDADGNLIRERSSSDVTTYSYDPENRLVGVTHGSSVQTYIYDALGQRVASTSSGATTRYVIDPTGLGNVVGQYDGAGNLIARYDHGLLGLVSQVDAAGASSYYDFDGVGSTVGITGSAGTILNTYTYAPFGERLPASETLANPFSFVGQFGVMSGGNDLDFMRARYYQPSLGRFLTDDPLNLGGGDTNLLRYVGNEPTRWVDPVGMLRWLPDDGGLTWHIPSGSGTQFGGGPFPK
jgi:RHS repeat-associated protein